MSGRVDVRHVPKPWGHETIWAHTDRYVGKILHIKAGHALSVQYHERKDETVYLLSGETEVLGAARPGDRELRDQRLHRGSVVPHHAGHHPLHGGGHRLRRARGHRRRISTTSCASGSLRARGHERAVRQRIELCDD